MKARTQAQKQAHHQMMLSKAHAARMKRSDNARDWESTPPEMSDEARKAQEVRRKIELRRDRQNLLTDWWDGQ